MEFYPTLEETLARRFDDMDEVRDISNHGIDCGFADFLYYYDINEFYNRYEREIETVVIDDIGYTYEQLSEGITSFQELRCKCVWIVAELFCHRKVELVEEAELCAC